MVAVPWFREQPGPCVTAALLSGTNTARCWRPTPGGTPTLHLPRIHLRGDAAWDLLQYFRSKEHEQFVNSMLSLFLLRPEIPGETDQFTCEI